MLAQRFHTAHPSVAQSSEGVHEKATLSQAKSKALSDATHLAMAEDAPNLIFLAGVEGAGHHFMHKFMNRIVPNHITFPPAWPCGGPWSPDGKVAMRDKLTGLQKGGMYMLYDHSCQAACDSMSSYPCGGGSHYNRNQNWWPLLDWIAGAAQDAGVVLHVIFLHRNLEDCLAADCLHRHMESCDNQAQTLSHVGSVLAAQLWTTFGVDHENAINPANVSCFQYGDLDTLNAAMDDIFGKGRVPQDLIDTVWQDRPARGQRAAISNWHDLLGTMARSDSALSEACRASGQSTLGTLMQLARH